MEHLFDFGNWLTVTEGHAESDHIKGITVYWILDKKSATPDF
jgi:hypothetical protein